MLRIVAEAVATSNLPATVALQGHEINLLGVGGE